MKPTRIISGYRAPCEYCWCPVAYTKIYPNGRLIVHTDRRRADCGALDVINQPQKLGAAA